MARIGIDLNLNQRSGLITRPDQIDAPAHMQMLIKRAAVALEKHYPGWAWAVASNANGGQIIITARRLDPAWGYHLNLPNIQGDPSDRWAIKAGAECLHRYGFHASGFMRQESAWRQAPRDEQGVLIPDLSGDQSSKIRQQMEISRKLATGQAKIVDLPDGRRVIRMRK